MYLELLHILIYYIINTSFLRPDPFYYSTRQETSDSDSDCRIVSRKESNTLLSAEGVFGTRDFSICIGCAPDSRCTKNLTDKLICSQHSRCTKCNWWPMLDISGLSLQNHSVSSLIIIVASKLDTLCLLGYGKEATAESDSTLIKYYETRRLSSSVVFLRGCLRSAFETSSSRVSAVHDQKGSSSVNLEQAIYGNETTTSNSSGRAWVVRTLPNIAAQVSQSLTAIAVSEPVPL